MPPAKTSGLSLVKLIMVGGRLPDDCAEDGDGVDCDADGDCTVTHEHSINASKTDMHIAAVRKVRLFMPSSP